MAITGISYGRTFVYETQKRVNEGVLQSTSDAENRFAERLTITISLFLSLTTREKTLKTV